MSRFGVVVIGRNEGARLLACLHSLRDESNWLVYVDSGSIDGSAGAAREAGVEVVELDPSRPFTAGRARNEGFRRLLEIEPVEFVQFVDGDCEMREGWLRLAAETLAPRPRLAIVCGRLRERVPEQSIYNRLCDMEWDASVGEVKACGGVFMIRVRAFEEVGGFDSSLIAGEEPDLCNRLRRGGWRIRRIAEEMALHDAAMTRFGQWWRRAVRSGHAAAEGAWRSRRSGGRDLRRVVSILLWTIGIPALALFLATIVHPAASSVLAAYPAQWLRIHARRRRMRSNRDSTLSATFTFIGKFAELCGIWRFLIGLIVRRPSRIIEHRDDADHRRIRRVNEERCSHASA